MKRAASFLIIFALTAGLAGLLPAPAAEAASGLYIYEPAADPARAKARAFALQFDKFTLDGQEIAVELMFRYEFIHMPADIAVNPDYAWEWFDLQTPRPLSDRNSRKNSGYSFGARDGDVIYLREKDTDGAKSGNQPSNWTVVKVSNSMMALLSGYEHLVYMDEPTSFTLVAENPFTSYEYAVRTEGNTGGNIEWVPLGTADPETLRITGYTLPRCGRYTILTRVQGDTIPANVRDCVGRTYDKTMLDLRSEVIALGGTKKLVDTVYHVTIKGKKSIYNVASGSDTYIHLGKVLGNTAVEISVAVQLDVETAAGASDSAKNREIPTQELLSKTIKPRPVINKAVTQVAFISNDNPDSWTLEAEATLRFEYGPAVKGNTLWTPFDRKKGLPLLTALEQKSGKKAESYFIRIAPVPETMTPASKEKKFNQIKQVKAPTLKPDYKKETIKIKSGLSYYIGKPSDDLKAATFIAAGAEPLISITEALNNNAVIYIYTKENGKKSRSAVQAIQLAPRFIAVDNGEGGMVSNKGVVKLEKGFEAFNAEKSKWGALPKGVNNVLVRRKATAKYNAKTAVNTGYAASTPVLFHLTYDEKGKKPITAACRTKTPSGLTDLVLRIQSGGDKLDMPFTVAQRDYVLGLKAGAKSATFTLQAEGAKIEAYAEGSLDLKVTSYGKLTATEAKPGTVLHIIALPNDPNNQCRDEYTVTIGMPFAAAPERVIWSDTPGGKGRFTVEFAPEKGPQTGDVLQWDLYARPNGDASKEEWIYQGIYIVPEAEYGKTRFELDAAEIILKHHDGETPIEYRAAVRVRASDLKSMSPETSTGSEEYPNLTVTQETLGLSIVGMYGPYGPAVPLFAPERTDILEVYALDDLGNVISVSDAHITWYRASDRLNITAGDRLSTGDSYEITAEDVGKYIGVTVEKSGETRTFCTIGRVAGSGANLTILNVQNAKPRPAVQAGMAFTTFTDGAGNPTYDVTRVDIDGLQRAAGAITLSLAENSQNASASYAISGTLLSAEPVWQEWNSEPLLYGSDKYLYVRLVNEDGETAKIYCFEFNVLPKPVLVLSPDPAVLEMALNEVYAMSVTLEGRSGVPLGLTGDVSAVLHAAVMVSSDDIAYTGPITISGDFIEFSVSANMVGNTLITVYIYPDPAYANAFEGFNGFFGVLDTKAAVLEIPVYVTALAESERD